MKKKLFGIPNWWMLIPIGVSFLMILFGSFFDLQISNSMADINSGLARFNENFGILLGYALIPFGGGMVFLGCWRSKNLWARIIGAVVLALAIFVGGWTYSSKFIQGKGTDVGVYGYTLSTNGWLCYLYAVGFFIAFAALPILVIKKDIDTKKLIAVGTAVLLTVVVQYFVLLLLKRIGGRPRYRFLFWEGYGDATYEGISYTFRNWWEFAGWSPKTDKLASWPSGHSATFAMLMSLGHASSCFRWQNKYVKPCCFFGGLLIAVLAATTRIIAGAHYLSDIGFGLLFGTLIIWGLAALSDLILNKVEKHQANKNPEEPEAIGEIEQ